MSIAFVFAMLTANFVSAQSADRAFKGIVTHADDGEQLAGVHIQLKGTSFGTVTDASGKFEFPQKLKVQDVLVFSFVGLKTLEFAITETSPDFLNIQMTYEEFTMVGELGDDGVFSARKRPLAWFWDGLKRNK